MIDHLNYYYREASKAVDFRIKAEEADGLPKGAYNRNKLIENKFIDIIEERCWAYLDSKETSK